MRKDYFMTLLACLFMALAQTAQAGVEKFYGTTNTNTIYQDRVPSFVYGDNNYEFTQIAPIDKNDPAIFMASGANCNGTYYGLLAKDGAALKFVTVDWTNGTTTDVATVDASFPLFTDMAYNYSTKKLYGIVTAAEGGTDIYEVDAANGTATKATNVAEELNAFEFSFDGTMHTFYTKKYDTVYGNMDVLYVKSYDKDLANPTEEVMVQSGWDPYILIYDKRISMEFDYMTNTLYYTSCGNSQQYANGIDVTTWKQTSDAIMLGGNYPDIMSMYIPFTAPEGGAETPTAVTELKAEADQTGAYKTTLTWTNPTKNFVGGNLTELYSVKIYRNSISTENLLAEITQNVTPGAQMSWTDENAVQGENKYVIVPCRIENENGISAEVTIWVGYDIPGPVANIKLEKVEGGINVSWEKPTTTAHNGVLDLTTLKYTVVRQPDNIVIAEDITETNALDKNALPTWQKYSYQITAKTAAGSSEATDGYMSIFAGPDITAPYEFAFNDYELYEQMWTNIGDEMGVGWFDSYEGCWSLMLPGWAQTQYGKRNNYLISPEIKLTAGKYTISVGSWIQTTNLTNSFTLLYGKGKTVEALTNNIESFTYTATTDGQKDMATATFEIAEDGFYNFGINVTAPITDPDNYPYVGINYFKVEEVQAEAFKVTGKVTDAAGNAIEGAEITIHNDGNQFTATTAADGTFTIDANGSKGECIIVINKEGFKNYRSYFNYEGTDINLETIVMEQTAETFFVKGKIVDENDNAIAEATVIVAMGDQMSSAITQADGTFNLEMYGTRGEYTIAIEKEGYNAHTGKLNYEGTDIDLGTIVLRQKAETFFVTGKVTDGEGKAIEDALVVVGMGYNVSPAQTTADGTFNIEVFGVRGEYSIYAEKDGYTPYNGTFTYEGANVNIENIVLLSTTGIGGIVYDADGNADIRVYDMSGRLVKAGKVSRNEGLGLSKGIYIINGKKTVVK